jgi:SAM-dependent methyltransferase
MQPAAIGDMTNILRLLYEQYLEKFPGDDFLNEHRGTAYLNSTVETFRFYEPYLPTTGKILDWGCHHAPDACLIRSARGDAVELHGCDVHGDRYRLFYDFAGLQYEYLQYPIHLPYPNDNFDVVVASGVLEHVPFDYESLKELYRVLKPGGRLILTYLPNIGSIAEWWRRRRKRPAHLRLYSKSQAFNLLLHSGFRPLVLSFQDRMDVLPTKGGNYRVNDAAFRLLRPLLRLARLERLSSCLCAVAEKATYL